MTTIEKIKVIIDEEFRKSELIQDVESSENPLIDDQIDDFKKGLVDAIVGVIEL